MNNILIYTLLILFIIIILIMIFASLEDEKEEDKKEIQEPIKNYLQLQNMTTQEILLFKNKNEFIKTIKDYDTIKYFLKGTEDENIKQLITWYYPGYERLD